MILIFLVKDIFEIALRYKFVKLDYCLNIFIFLFIYLFFVKILLRNKLIIAKLY